MPDVGDVIEAENAAWSFGGCVAGRFDEHIEKSVPLYREGHDLVLAVSDFVVGPQSRCYDLGCATGTLGARLAERHVDKQVTVVGIDNEAEMVAEARRRHSDTASLEFVQADLVDFELEPCDLVVAYYTLQFVRPRSRQQVFDRIYQALNWGGAFLLFEKVRAPDARFQDMMTALHVDLKLERGFAAEEVVAKARSLKGVLEPFSTDGNLGLLQRAGFTDIMTMMKYVCFEGFLALK